MKKLVIVLFALFVAINVFHTYILLTKPVHFFGPDDSGAFGNISITILEPPGEPQVIIYHPKNISYAYNYSSVSIYPILVVAADEGIKPQTHEHLMTLQAKKVQKIIVVQNKIDLVDIKQAKKNYQEIKTFLGEHYAHAEVIPVSAQQNVNIKEVLRAIAELPIPERKIDAIPVFLVARSFDINRPGTIPSKLNGAVLGGTLKQGKFKLGDEIEIKPGRPVGEGVEKKYLPLKTKITNLFIGSKKVQELTPGGSMSIETELDMTLGKSDLLSGNLASHIGKLPNPEKQIKLKYTLFPQIIGISSHVKVGKIEQKEMLMLSINTSITGGVVNSTNEKEVSLGLKVPAILFKGDNVGIARKVQGRWRLIGYGEVI